MGRLVFLDECEVHRHPRLAKVWCRRCQPLRVPAAGEDRTFAVFGALDYASGRLLWKLSSRTDGAAFVAFLDKLLAELPDGPLVVVLDNVDYYKGRLAKDRWMAHQDRVRPLWLPAYAPELNLTERVWCQLKDKLSCHRWWADLEALEQATAGVLSQLTARFHQPDGGGISPVRSFSATA